MTYTFSVTKNIWSEDRGRFERVTFTVSFDPDDLPRTMFNKAARSKNGKSSIAGGAVTVKVEK